MEGDEAIPCCYSSFTEMENRGGLEEAASYECWFYSPVRSDLDRQEVLYQKKKIPRDGKLYDAIWKRDIPRVKYLLGKGHDLNRCFFGLHNTLSYPLHCAVQTGDDVMLGVLLTAGVTKDTCDGQGNTALTVAAMAGRLDTVNILLAAGSCVNAINKDGHSALLEVIKTHYNEEVLDALLTAGADTNVHDLLGYTPLHVVCDTRSNPVRLVRKLLAAGARVDACDNKGNTVLMTAASRRPGQYAMRYHIPPDMGDLTEVLLGAGADVNQHNQHGTTALHVACRNTDASLPVVKQLLVAGSDVNAVDVKGRTPLLVATGNGIRELLLQCLADPDHESRAQQTALLKAIRHRNVESVRLLVLANTDVNRRLGSRPVLYTLYTDCFRALRRLQDKPALWPDIVACFRISHLLLTAGAHVGFTKWRPMLLAMTCLLQNYEQATTAPGAPMEGHLAAQKALDTALWFSQNPRPLFDSCCAAIRGQLRPNFYKKLDSLVVPDRMRRAIVMEHLHV